MNETVYIQPMGVSNNAILIKHQKIYSQPYLPPHNLDLLESYKVKKQEACFRTSN